MFYELLTPGPIVTFTAANIRDAIAKAEKHIPVELWPKTWTLEWETKWTVPGTRRHSARAVVRNGKGVVQKSYWYYIHPMVNGMGIRERSMRELVKVNTD